MNITIDNILSIIIGIGMIAALIIGTILIIPAACGIILAKVDCDTWLEAVKDIYINMPTDYLLCKLD